MINIHGGGLLIGNKEFNKDDNGYGSSKKFDWVGQRNATVGIVMDYGVKALSTAKLKVVSTTSDETGSVTSKSAWFITVDGEEVKTAATWTDLNSNTAGKGYSSYAQLIKAAYDKAIA